MTDELRGYERQRAAIHRKFRRMLAALALLRDTGLLSQSDYEAQRVRAIDLFETMKQKRILERPKIPLRGGRPRSTASVCRRPGCDEPAENGYCCREHAPLGYYGIPVPVYLGTE